MNTLPTAEEILINCLVHEGLANLNYVNIAMKAYAKAVLKYTAERAKLKVVEGVEHFVDPELVQVDKDSILDIIKELK